MTTEKECAICLGTPQEPETLPCGHCFCADCIVQLRHSRKDNTGGVSCPLCRAPIPPLRGQTAVVAQRTQQHVAALRESSRSDEALTSPSEAVATVRRMLETVAAQQREALLRAGPAFRAARLAREAASHQASTPAIIAAGSITSRQRDRTPSSISMQAAHRRTSRSPPQRALTTVRRPPWRHLADEERAQSEREQQRRHTVQRARRARAEAEQHAARHGQRRAALEARLEMEAAGHRADTARFIEHRIGTGNSAAHAMHRASRGVSHAELLQRYDDVAVAVGDRDEMWAWGNGPMAPSSGAAAQLGSFMYSIH